MIRALTFLTLLAASCGGGGSAIDAPVDAPGLDADPLAICTEMCQCRVAVCGETDLQGCITNCAALPVTVQDCRLTHCGFASAPNGAQEHCPHTLGMDNTCTFP